MTILFVLYYFLNNFQKLSPITKSKFPNVPSLSAHNIYNTSSASIAFNNGHVRLRRHNNNNNNNGSSNAKEVKKEFEVQSEKKTEKSSFQFRQRQRDLHIRPRRKLSCCQRRHNGTHLADKQSVVCRNVFKRQNVGCCVIESIL